MKLLFIGNDTRLKTSLEETGMFSKVTIGNTLEGVKDEFDMLLISDKEIAYNDLVLTHDKYFGLLNKKPWCYMVSNYDTHINDNISSICKAKNIHLIPPRLTVNQIKEKILNIAFPGSGVNKRNIIAYLGADSKVGTTMTALSTAEWLANNTYSNVLLMFLNPHPSTSYIKHKDSEILGLDNLKQKIMSNIISDGDIENACIKRDNLHILPGLQNILDMRYYRPEHIETLINHAADEFSTVIIDAGSCYSIELHAGFVIPVLNMANKKYLVTTQQPTAYSVFERTETQIFKRLGINPSEFLVVINKLMTGNGVPTAQNIADNYKMTLATSLPHLDFIGWQAEFENNPLTRYDNKIYNSSIENLARLICAQLDISFSQSSTKKKTIVDKTIGLLKNIGVGG